MLIPTLVAALAVGVQAEASVPWKTLVSQEGRFVVDFPSDPTSNSSRTQNGPGGKLKVVTVRCDSPEVDYMILQMTLPTAIVKGAEDGELNNFRDYFAKEVLKGKVVSEKKVRYDAKTPGRDFTVRAQTPQGVATIRVREYLSGKAMYGLFAIAAANRELPEDAGRFFGSFAIGTTRMKKTGPKPEPEGKDLAGWGKAIDPDGDCKIAGDSKALVIDIPGTLHDLNADIDKYNAPRVLREVEGDFDVKVKVSGEFAPGEKSNNPKSVPYNGAGIFVWRDSDNFIRLERAAMIQKKKQVTFSVFEEREGGSRGAVHNGQLTPGTAYLRLTRRGSRIVGLTSKDGQHWTALRPIDTVWSGPLKVGLNAINSSNAPFSVKFEDFVFKGKTP